MNIDTNKVVFWILVLALVYFILQAWNEMYSVEMENFDKTKSDNKSNNSEKSPISKPDNGVELSQTDVKVLKTLARSISSGNVKLPNLRITGDLVIDGNTHCKRGVTTKEIKSIIVSGNVVDGATVKGENVRDNENLLVKRGQRIRITDGRGAFQIWTIDKNNN